MNDELTTWPHEDMVRAFIRENWDRGIQGTRSLTHNGVRNALARALAAAPTADGWVWCGRQTDEVSGHVYRRGWPMREYHCNHGLALGNCGEDCPPCPGPHRTLLLGPTVEEDR